MDSGRNIASEAVVTYALRERFGLPNVSGRRGLVAAIIIDSLGSGLFLPFAVLFFLNTTTIALSTIGLGLTVAALLALPTAPLIGILVDRIGPKRIIVCSSLLQAAGFASYLWVDRPWQLIGGALVINVGQNMFWTGNGALVALAADPDQRARWFAMFRVLRNAGIGLGALLAATLTLGGPAGYHSLVIGNAASFLVAAALTAAWRPATRPAAPAPSAPTADPGPRGRGYRAVLTDRPFALLILINSLFVLCTLVLTVVLSVYVTRVLHQGPWAASALFALATIMVVLTQTVVSRMSERRPTVRILRLAAVLWAGSFALLWGVMLVPSRAVIPALFVAVTVYTAAEVVYSPAMSVLVLSVSPPSSRGRYFGVHQLSWSIPSALAPAVFTALLAWNPHWLWVALILVCLLIVAALGRLARLLPSTDTTAPLIKAAAKPTDRSARQG
jgi:MFS family permease